MFNDNYVRTMLAALRGKIGATVTLTFSGGSTVAGVLTAGPAAPDQFHDGGQMYLVSTGGAIVQPNWGEVCAVSYPAG